jgi:hypothetical protein
MGNFVPRFRDARIQEATVCAFFHCDDPAVFAGSPIRVQAKCFVNDGEPGWVRAMLTCDDDDNVHGHFHVEVGREPYFSRREDLKEEELEFVSQLIRRMGSQKCSLFLGSDFLVPLDDLPRRGMISALLDLSTQAAGTELTLTGAKFSVADDPYLDVKWELDDEGESLAVELTAFLEGAIAEDYLHKAADLLQTGFESFVLESPSKKKASNEHWPEDQKKAAKA